MKCRHCGADLTLGFLDLGSAPPSNAYLTDKTLHEPELWFPLRILVCESCWLVQTEDYAGREALFSADYAYHSSVSSSWLIHSKRYVTEVVQRFVLGADSTVVEIAANDGYLLQYFKALGIPCYGVEPTASTAAVARSRGIEIVEEFFGATVARELATAGRSADLIVANNVLAHVPDINDFLEGFSILLKADGVITFEFPYLLNLVVNGQFDTVYHEHYSYLSLGAAERVLASNGLAVFDVEELPTHGGSLRVYAQRTAGGPRARTRTVDEMRQRETEAGMETPGYYAQFQSVAENIKNDLLSFLLSIKNRGKKIGAYGAAAKGNTLLNFAGVKPDLLPYVVDRNPAKQEKFMPGSRIPIVDEQHFETDRPDYILILPWNLVSELEEQLRSTESWGATLVTAVPRIQTRTRPNEENTE